MILRRILLAVVLVDFLALTGWALARHGVIGWVGDLVSTPVGILAAVDLLIALSFAVGWMWTDARRAGRNPWPYIVLTLCTGSAGPLLYLLLREQPRTERAPLPAA